MSDTVGRKFDSSRLSDKRLHIERFCGDKRSDLNPFTDLSSFIL